MKVIIMTVMVVEESGESGDQGKDGLGNRDGEGRAEE
jgi:hypothetical protein